MLGTPRWGWLLARGARAPPCPRFVDYDFVLVLAVLVGMAIAWSLSGWRCHSIALHHGETLRSSSLLGFTRYSAALSVLVSICQIWAQAEYYSATLLVLVSVLATPASGPGSWQFCRGRAALNQTAAKLSSAISVVLCCMSIAESQFVVLIRRLYVSRLLHVQPRPDILLRSSFCVLGGLISPSAGLRRPAGSWATACGTATPGHASSP